MHPKLTIGYSRKGNTNKNICAVKIIQKIKNLYKKA